MLDFMRVLRPGWKPSSRCPLPLAFSPLCVRSVSVILVQDMILQGEVSRLFAETKAKVEMKLQTAGPAVIALDSQQDKQF